MKNFEKAKIVYCENCKDTPECKYCNGEKYYLEIANYSIYFKKEYDETSILIDQIKQIISIIFTSILSIFVFIGFASLAYHIYNLISSGSNFFARSNWLGLNMLIFWIGSVFAMFLFYKIKNSSYIKESVVGLDEFINNKKHKSVNAYNAFSKEAKKILLEANYLAIKEAKSISPLYILYSMLDDDNILIILSRLGIQKEAFKLKVKRLIDNSLNKNEKVYFIDCILNSYYFASLYKSEYVKMSHLLIAISSIDERVFELFYDMGIDGNQLKNAIAWIKLRDDIKTLYKKYRRRASFKPGNSMNRSMTAVATPILDKFSSDLTILAKYGYLDLVVARDDKIEEIYRAIETSSKGVLIIGMPGTGKESVINGLANKMSAEDVPELLKDKRLVSLSLSKFISEASNGGNIEFLFIKVMEEIARAGNIILVIQDIHNVVGVASVGSQTIDLSKILTDSIERYGLIVIGTTSQLEYKKYLENNSLTNLMNPVELPETDFDETVQVLEAKCFAVEFKHKVYFSYQALEKIVKLSNEYIHTFAQPGKANKILEEVAIMVKKSKDTRRLVIAEDVAKLISQKVNIPLTSVTQSEAERLLNLEHIMHERIVGQNEAVDMVSSALRRSREELRDENKPITNLLFLGPTGVGKTELAKTVAEIFFGSEEDMIRLDMSEYQEKSSIGRLIGVEGSNDGGVLTEMIKKNPYCLLLLDEIEKAHPDILNVFLQVMDDGRLTDSKGETVDFTNCIIIATSNAGAYYIQDKLAQGVDLETIKNDLIINELRQNFRPEFLNRFNGVILFRSLNPKEVEQITVLMLSKISRRLEEKGIFFSASKDAVSELAQMGFSKEFGARPLQRVIEQRVNDSLANMLLTGKIGRRDRVILEIGGEIRVEKASKF